jgi:hypothetical protein
LEQALNIQNEVLEILDEVLSLKGRAKSFSDQTVLLGALPELDSMAALAGKGQFSLLATHACRASRAPAISATGCGGGTD